MITKTYKLYCQFIYLSRKHYCQVSSLLKFEEILYNILCFLVFFPLGLNVSLLFNLRDFPNIKHHTLNVWSQGKQLVLLSESPNVS